MFTDPVALKYLCYIPFHHPLRASINELWTRNGYLFLLFANSHLRVSLQKCNVGPEMSTSTCRRPTQNTDPQIRTVS